MAELKTKKTAVSVEDFLDSIVDEKKRADAYELLAMFKKATKLKPRMWGPTMIGFGDRHYKYASGHEGDTFISGFSPRKAAHSLYLTCGIQQFTPQLKRLGKHKTGVGCLYINKLADIDKAVLQEMIDASFNSGEC